MSIIQEAAKNYIQHGYSVIPAGLDKKVIGLLKPYFTKAITENEIPKKFNGAPAIGLICGEISNNTEVLDIDDVSCHEPLTSMIKIKHIDILDRLVFTKTPRGFGVIYRVEPGVDIGGHQDLAFTFIEQEGPGPHNWNGRSDLQAKEYNGKWYTKAARLETRATGNYTMICPSPGYEILEGSLEDLQPISAEDRKSILDLARTFNQWPEDEEKPQKHSAIFKKRIPTPWDIYNNSIDYEILLRQAGWKKVGKVKNGTTWSRPGGTPNKGSATLHYDGKLHVFSSNAAPLEANEQYTAYAFLTYMDYDGDFQVSANALTEAGYIPDMSIEEVTEVLKDDPDQLENAYRKSGLTEAEVSQIAIDLGLVIPPGKGVGRVEIFYDETELNRVVEEMDRAVSTISGKWGYYKFMTILGFVNRDNSFQMYETSNFELRCEQSFYMTKYVKQGKKSVIKNVKIPDGCVNMLMKYPDISAQEIRGFASHPTLLNGKIIGLQDGFQDGIMFQDCEQFEIDDRPFMDCYNRLIDLFCVDMLFPDPELGPALFVSMLMTAVARLGIDGGCPGYLITANSPGTGKSTLFEIVSRVVYGKLFPSVRWKESSEEMSKELVSYLRRGKECMLYDNIKQKKAIDNEDLAQLITAGCFEGRLLGLSEEITVDARAMFVFIGNDIKVAAELARRIMTVQLRAEKDNPERRPVQIKRIAEYCDTHRVEAMGCILKMLQEGTTMADKLDHTSGLEFWDRVVRNPILGETQIDISGGFDISATQSEENQSVKSIVFLLADVFGIGNVFYTKDIYLAIADYLRPEEQSAADQIRALKEDECGALRDALIDVNQRAAMSSQSTGNALKSLSDYQISGGLKFVRHVTKSNQPRKHWIENVE